MIDFPILLVDKLCKFVNVKVNVSKRKEKKFNYDSKVSKRSSLSAGLSASVNVGVS